jgi:cell division septation protein DedD
MDLFSQPPYEEPTSPKPAKEEAPKSEAAPAKADPVADKPAPETAPSAPATSQEESPKPAERDKPVPVPTKVDAAWAKPAVSQGSAEKPGGSSAASKTTAPAVTKQKAAAATRNDRYYLVVGAFGDQANAERMVADLRADGHSAQLVPSAVGTTKVAAAVVNSQQEAYAKRDVLKKTFPAVWVFQGNK